MNQPMETLAAAASPTTETGDGRRHRTEVTHQPTNGSGRPPDTLGRAASDPVSLATYLERLGMLAEESPRPGSEGSVHYLTVALIGVASAAIDGLGLEAAGADAPLIVHERVLGRLAERTAGRAIPVPPQDAGRIEALWADVRR